MKSRLSPRERHLMCKRGGGSGSGGGGGGGGGGGAVDSNGQVRSNVKSEAELNANPPNPANFKNSSEHTYSSSNYEPGRVDIQSFAGGQITNLNYKYPTWMEVPAGSSSKGVLKNTIPVGAFVQQDAGKKTLAVSLPDMPKEISMNNAKAAENIKKGLMSDATKIAKAQAKKLGSDWKVVVKE